MTNCKGWGKSKNEIHFVSWNKKGSTEKLKKLVFMFKYIL